MAGSTLDKYLGGFMVIELSCGFGQYPFSDNSGDDVYNVHINIGWFVKLWVRAKLNKTDICSPLLESNTPLNGICARRIHFQQ